MVACFAATTLASPDLPDDHGVGLCQLLADAPSPRRFAGHVMMRFVLRECMLKLIQSSAERENTDEPDRRSRTFDSRTESQVAAYDSGYQRELLRQLVQNSRGAGRKVGTELK
jgi:hypothetical protein